MQNSRAVFDGVAPLHKVGLQFSKTHAFIHFFYSMVESFGNIAFFIRLKISDILILSKFQKLTIRIWMYIALICKKC